MKNYSKNSLQTNAILNAIKQGCAVLFPFISFAYCSRILGSEKIGMYSFGQSIINYFLLMAALGIVNYSIREGATLRDNHTRVQTFINEIFTINIYSTLFSYVLLFIVVIAIPKLDAYKYILFIQSFQIILTTLGADWINSIFEDYFYLAIRYIIIQLISLLLLFIFVRKPSDIYLYTFITVFSNTGGNILNIWYLRHSKGISFKIVRYSNFRKHLVPIFILFFNSIASTIYLNSDITMLGWLTTNKDVGIYTVSSNIYSMTKTLINAIIMVTIPRFSYCLANNKINEFHKQADAVFNALLLFIFPVLTGIFMEADKILLFVGGREYVSGTASLKILSISLFFAVSACFFSYSILLPSHSEKKFMYSTIVAATTNILLNIYFIPNYGILGASFTTLLAEIVVFCMSSYYSKKIYAITINIRNLFSILIGCMLIIFVCYISQLYISGPLLQFGVSVIGSVSLYFIVLFILKNPLISSIKNLF